MSRQRRIVNLALIGFMGSGKSSVGRLVAESLGFEFVDTDSLIEASTGRTISDLFAQNGENAFRELETRVVGELAARHHTVISTGGGLAARQENLDNLKQHALVVCLWASPEKIWERVRHQTHRPLLQDANPLARIRELLEQRESVYKLADVLVNTEMRPLKEVAQQVVHHFNSVRSRPS
ncbi:MAG TPA: shikimate kinase [Methylomirabilota bacterium]|nr:shikimate kinase [Methylomirabilota bacterium]